jgi:putative sterol carrier protein
MTVTETPSAPNGPHAADNIEYVEMTAPAAYVWDYDTRRDRLTKLYEKSKTSQWNATTDLDWTVDVDITRDIGDEAGFAAITATHRGGPIQTFLRSSEENYRHFVAENHAWLVSQFMHGEQGALVATAKICAGAETIDDKFYAAQQVADEARHVEAYQRYISKIGADYPVSASLNELLRQVTSHRHIDMTYLGMQILVEGVALAAFGFGGAMLANPLIADITRLVRADEARHVAFGVLSLQGFYDNMDRTDLAEREDFVLEACSLIRDRFEPIEMWERLGLPVDECIREVQSAPDHHAIQALIFSKVVPNLRKLGLITPRVRDGLETLGVLKFQHNIDSATEAGLIEVGEFEREVDQDDLLGHFRKAMSTVDRIEPGPVLQMMMTMVDRAELRAAPDARFRITVDGAESPDWLLEVAGDAIEHREWTPADTADLSLRMDQAVFTDIVAGRITAPEALLNGKIAIEGDIMKAAGLQAVL